MVLYGTTYTHTHTHDHIYFDRGNNPSFSPFSFTANRFEEHERETVNGVFMTNKSALMLKKIAFLCEYATCACYSSHPHGLESVDTKEKQSR